MVSFDDVLRARERIGKYVLHTPLLRMPVLDEAMGCQVYAKLECTQITGSFKLRGAMNCMLMLSGEERRRGVVCPSSGNHAQALAYAARLLGCSAKIVMPDTCNPVKLANTRGYGAEVVLVDLKEREAETQRIIESEGRTLVHAFADPRVKAGQGTISLEILDDEPDIDAVVVPIGGGGLISGIAAGAKGRKPGIRVYGIENKVAARYTTCRRLGHAADLEVVGQTIADGVRGNHADDESYEMIDKLVDELILVGDEWIRPAVKTLITRGHILAEPASCMTLAAAMAGTLPVKKTDKVAFVLSGGNCDMDVITDILKND